MKKKIICSVFAALFALSAFGCSAGDATVSFDSDKPWKASGYEVCEYEVKKVYVGGSDEIVVAEGTYTTTLAPSTASNDYYTVKNDFRITYNDNEHTETMDETGKMAINKGLTDTYSSEVTFRKDSMVPIAAKKSFNIAQRPLFDDENGLPAAMPERTDNPAEGVLFRYEMPSGARYSDPRGYSYEVDYAASKASLTTEKGETNKVSADGNTYYNRDYKAVNFACDVKNNTRFDNEQLNYIVRAMSNTKKKSSGTFYLSNIYDSYVRGGYVRYTMGLSCADKTKPVDMDASVFYIKDGETPLEATDGKYSVPCVNATVSVSSSTPGPGISMLITDPSIDIAQKGNESFLMKKLIVEMRYTEYSPTSARRAYETVYTLKNYKTQP